MVRFVFLLPALLAWLAVAAPAITATPEGAWRVNCSVDAMTDMRTCMAELRTAVETGYGGAWVFVRVVRLGEGAMIGVATAETLCYRRLPMIRVDRNKAMNLAEFERGGFLLGAAADNLIKQFIAGNSALVRVHFSPSCAERDFRISLSGFTAAWRRLQREEATAGTQPPAEQEPREMTQQTPILGNRLTISEIDAVRRQIEPCWNVQIGTRNPKELIVDVRLYMNRDGTVRKVEIIDTARMRSDVFFRAAADSARRAVQNKNCTPLKLPPDKYDQWQQMVLRFDPSQMVGR